MRDQHSPEVEEHDPLVDMGYETQDLDYKKLGKAAAGFFGFFIISIVIAYFFFMVANPNGWSEPKLADKANRIPGAPAPVLQTDETARTDIMELRQNETKELNEYKTLDSGKGVYRIPVDRAMDIIASRGLPVTAPQASTPGQTKPYKGAQIDLVPVGTTVRTSAGKPVSAAPGPGSTGLTTAPSKPGASHKAKENHG